MPLRKQLLCLFYIFVTLASRSVLVGIPSSSLFSCISKLTNISAGAFRPVHRRTEMLLRALVVVLSLGLLYDDPGLDEWEDVAGRNMQDGEELQRNGAQPHHKMALVIQEVTPQPHRPDAGGDDAGVFLLEGGSDHDIPKEDQQLRKNSHVVQTAVGEDAQVDLSLSPNQSGKTVSSQHQKHDVFSSEKQSPPSQLHIRTAGKGAVESPVADCSWYMWNAFSILSMIHLLRKCLGRRLRNKHQTQCELATYPPTEVMLPDSNTLLRFHSRCIRALSDNRSWETAFLEGFANDLLDVMRSVCDESGSTVIEDFQMADVRNIIVPFTPPEPYRFQCSLRKDQIDMQMCGQIEVVRAQSQSCCPCQSLEADDLVCLLHCDTEQRMKPDVCGLLCLKDSLLSKSQVTKWFQSTIKQAWGIISHKYEFELNIGYIDTPGALQVRLRSGKVVGFTMNPVVKFNAGAYFLTSHTPSSSDNTWTLSLGGYEECFFQEMTRYLPVNSCVHQTLEIALFLHRRQAVLTGGSELKDSHFKMALMHLLLIRDPPQWKPEHLERRLLDLLDFVKKSLEKKMLPHVLVGNPSIRKVARVPAELTQADAVNLFHPLLMHNCLHRNAAKHFQEILRNAHILIDDYVHLCSGPEAQ